MVQQRTDEMFRTFCRWAQSNQSEANFSHHWLTIAAQRGNASSTDGRGVLTPTNPRWPVAVLIFSSCPDVGKRDMKRTKLIFAIIFTFFDYSSEVLLIHSINLQYKRVQTSFLAASFQRGNEMDDEITALATYIKLAISGGGLFKQTLTPLLKCFLWALHKTNTHF